MMMEGSSVFDWLQDHRLETAASAPAGASGPTRKAPYGAPKRSATHWTGRAAALVLLAGTLGLLLFLGGVLVRGASDLTEEASATDLATDLCGPPGCTVAGTGVEPPPREPLPREWRWEAKAVDLDHMHRNR
jgi:hypothetical protein